MPRSAHARFPSMPARAYGLLAMVLGALACVAGAPSVETTQLKLWSDDSWENGTVKRVAEAEMRFGDDNASGTAECYLGMLPKLSSPTGSGYTSNGASGQVKWNSTLDPVNNPKSYPFTFTYNGAESNGASKPATLAITGGPTLNYNINLTQANAKEVTTVLVRVRFSPGNGAVQTQLSNLAITNVNGTAFADSPSLPSSLTANNSNRIQIQEISNSQLGLGFKLTGTLSFTWPVNPDGTNMPPIPGYASMAMQIKLIEHMPVISCDCPKERSTSSSGSEGSGQEAKNCTKNPIRYHDGEINLRVTDLGSDGLGGLSLTRSFSNQRAYTVTNGVVGGRLGAGWSVTGWDSISQTLGNSMVSTVDGRDTEFLKGTGGNYTPKHFFTSKQTDSGGLFTQIDSNGNQLGFNNFTSSGPGRLVSKIDPAGNVTNITYGTAGAALGAIIEMQQSQTASGVTTFQSITYTYGYTHASNARLVGATLRRSTDGVSWTIVRVMEYRYYQFDDAPGTHFGNDGDLCLAILRDKDNNILEQSHYRYWLSTDTNFATKGCFDGIKYVVGPQAFERVTNAIGAGSILTAPDTVLAPYADNYFEYDAGRRVTRETVLGQGCSCSGSTGQGTYLYQYTHSWFHQGYNRWSVRTIETLPDGNTNTVYTNFAGEIMLRIFTDTHKTAPNQWCWFNQYDFQGRNILAAEPSAVLGSNDLLPDLLGFNGTSYANLADSSGLLHRTAYYAVTDPDATLAGATGGQVLGYAAYKQDLNGELATTLGTNVVYTVFTKYTKRVGGTVTTYPVKTQTIYRDAAGTLPLTTTYAYTWLGSTSQMASKTTTYPIVTTAQNGSNAATSISEFFDTNGRVAWKKDEDGYIHYDAYDPGTGAVTRHITDVKTTLTGDFANLPSGWTTPAGGGLHLKTSMVVDGLGRTTMLTDPRGIISYVVYKDLTHEMRTYPAWNATTFLPTGPTQVVREDRLKNYVETLTTSATPTLAAGNTPDGNEAIVTATLQSLSRSYRDTSGRPITKDAYISFAGLTYSTAVPLGTLNTHYYRSAQSYDDAGRLARTQDGAGTIMRSVSDGNGRLVSSWMGTNDTPASGVWSPANNTSPSNMVLVKDYTYDTGGIGDGNLTQTRSYADASQIYTTSFQYDWRDRQIQSRGPDKVALMRTLDNLGRATTEQTYADGDSNFVIGASELRGKKDTAFDDKGQTYQQSVYEVDPVSGAVSNKLTTDLWSNARGMPIKGRSPNKLFAKTLYDGAGRTVKSYTCYHDAETLYTDALTVASDTVVEQTNTIYDADSNVVTVTSLKRKDNDTTTTADLTPANAYFTVGVSWFDTANRCIGTGDYGRDNGTTRYIYNTSGVLIDADANGIPDEAQNAPRAPNSSDNYIIKKYDYDTAGRQYRTTNNVGIVDQAAFDAMGMTIKTIVNYGDGTFSTADSSAKTDQTTEFIYNPGWNLSIQRAWNLTSSGGVIQQQDTKYLRESPINASWPTSIIYPDSTDATSAGSDQVKYAYDRLGRKITFSDQRGTAHGYMYDTAGRLLSDAATVLGTGTDGAVRRIEILYDDMGRRQLVSSYNAVSAGTVLNQIKWTYNQYGQVAKSEQSVSGAVVSGTTPAVSYTYVDGASGGVAKYVRPVSKQYPYFGTTVYNIYPTSGTTGDHLNRLDSLASDAAGTSLYAKYSYIGTGTVCFVAHPQVSGGLNDVVMGINGTYGQVDQFERVAQKKWRNDASSVFFDRYDYTYDRVSRMTSSKISSSATASGFDQSYLYGPLNDLTGNRRGTVSSGAIADAACTFETFWNPDFQHNNGYWGWYPFGTTASGGVNSIIQYRYTNKANEIDTDDIGSNAAGNSLAAGGPTGGGNWLDPQFDAAGNMTFGPCPSNASWEVPYTNRPEQYTSNTYYYDAWNRIARIVTSSYADHLFQYDGLGRKISEAGIPFYYDENYRCLEPDGGGVNARQFIWDIRYVDAPVAILSDAAGTGTINRTLYYTFDAYYNITGLITMAGVVQTRYAYEPHGRPLIFDAAWTRQTTKNGGEWENPLFFRGRWYQGRMGVYDFRARFWDPSLGRFVSRDPVGYVDGMNLYNGYFVPNEMDPWGLWGTDGHNILINEAFSDLPKNIVSQLRRASAGADAPRYQTAATAYRHGMRAPNETPDQANEKTQLFIYASKKDAIMAWCRGSREEAMRLLGYGMHALMDTYSPAHRVDGVPQPWKLSSGIGDLLRGGSAIHDHEEAESVDVLNSKPEYKKKIEEDMRSYMDDFKNGIKQCKWCEDRVLK
jgi:RHS repeat-associated protein